MNLHLTNTSSKELWISANSLRNLARSLSCGFEERVIGSPVWGPILVITCAVAANVLIRIPATAAGAVPRLLTVAVAVTAGLSALHALLYGVLSRLVRRRPRPQMDKRELELGRLLDKGTLNPQRWMP